MHSQQSGYEHPPSQVHYPSLTMHTQHGGQVVVVRTPNQESFWGPFFSSFFLALFFGPIGLSFLCCYTTSINRRGVFVGVGSAMSAVGIGLMIAGNKLTNTCKEKYWCTYPFAYYSYTCDCNAYRDILGGIGGGWLAIGLLCMLVATIRWFQDYQARRNATQVVNSWKPAVAQTGIFSAVEKGENSIAGIKQQQQQHAIPVSVASSIVEEPTFAPAGSHNNVRQWSKERVGEWLENSGLTNLRDAFEANSIDGLAMISLTEGDMQTMKVPLGRIKRFFDARANLTNAV